MAAVVNTAGSPSNTDANEVSPSPSDGAHPPPTPNTRAKQGEADRKVKVATPSPAPQAYSQFFYNLYRDGSIYGANHAYGYGYNDPVGAGTAMKRPRSEGGQSDQSIHEWVMGAQAAMSDEPLPSGTPPLDPPLSPTAGAPFLPQSQRLKRRRDETYALVDDDQISDTDRTCLEDDYYDNDNVSDTEPLGPPVTEDEDYYVNRHLIEPSERRVHITPLEELTDRCGQPQDLFEQLQAEIAQLRWVAVGRPKMLAKIDQLESDAIVVVEMTKKLSRRLGFLERCVEQYLPELEDYKANSAMLKNLNYRLGALEEFLSGESQEDMDEQQEEQYDRLELDMRPFRARI